MKIALTGPRCGCGSRGCLEAFIGTAAILRLARGAMRRGSRILRRLATEHHGRLTPELISEAARRGDRAALRTWHEVGSYLGLGLASVINLLNPERIVIGGGVSKAWPYFASRLTATIRTHAFEDPLAACRILPATLGERGGIVGAAILVWERAK